MKRLAAILRITGLTILGLGVLLGFCDLQGWFTDSDKAAVLTWAKTSKNGLSINSPGAKKFAKAFPPPTSPGKAITHLTKQVIHPTLGGTMLVSVNYMYSDASRSAYVASLSDIENWVQTTSLPRITWLLSLLGFLEVLSSYLVEKRLQP